MTTPQANLILHHLRRVAARLEELPDRELLDRFVRQHDEEAFARLMRRHRPLVQGVALRVLGNWHDSEDVTQAVFLVLARKANSLGWHDSVFSIPRRSGPISGATADDAGSGSLGASRHARSSASAGNAGERSAPSAAHP